MIVITGPGRSGTSFLASVYQQLGFSPVVGGGGWHEGLKGGLEDVEIGRLNHQLIDELGMRSPIWRLADSARKLGDRLGRSQALGEGSPQAAAAGVGRATGSSMSRCDRLASLGVLLAEHTIGRQIPVVHWDRIAAIVKRHGAELRELSLAREVVKDPAFCSTLWVWAAAGAEIDYVLVSLRSLEVTASGLVQSGHLPAWSRTTAQNRVAYRLGLLLAALNEYRLPYGIVRFPDCLKDDDLLCDTLRFPHPVPRDRVIAAIEAVRNPEFVSTWR